MVPEIVPTNDLEKRIFEAFEAFDHVGNRSVDIREVGTIVRSLGKNDFPSTYYIVFFIYLIWEKRENKLIAGCCPTEAEIQEIIMNVEDPEATDSVHINKFLPYMAGIISEFK